jgi:hypothetical protein
MFSITLFLPIFLQNHHEILGKQLCRNERRHLRSTLLRFIICLLLPEGITIFALQPASPTYLIEELPHLFPHLFQNLRINYFDRKSVTFWIIEAMEHPTHYNNSIYDSSIKFQLYDENFVLFSCLFFFYIKSYFIQKIKNIFVSIIKEFLLILRNQQKWLRMFES